MEIIHNGEGIRFKVVKIVAEPQLQTAAKEPPVYSNGFAYVVEPTELLTPDYVDEIVELAKASTRKIRGVDDLDGIPHHSVDLQRFRTTHALEHIALTELAGLSLSVAFATLVGGRRGAMTYVYSVPDGEPRIEFTFQPKLAPGHSFELDAIGNACKRIADLGI